MSPAAPAPWLVTPRLRLREFCAADRHDLVRMHQEPRLRALLIDDEPLHRHDVAAEFLHRLQALYRRHEGLGIWCAQRMAAALPDDALADPELQALLGPGAWHDYAQPRPQFAGWFNLMPMPEAPHEIELGSRLLPSAWGTGLALHGGELLLRHAFERLQRERVWAVSHPQHEAVRYCVLALGFEELGLRPYDGRPARHFLIERAAWLARRDRPQRERVRAALRRMRSPLPLPN